MVSIGMENALDEKDPEEDLNLESITKEKIFAVYYKKEGSSEEVT